MSESTGTEHQPTSEFAGADPQQGELRYRLHRAYALAPDDAGFTAPN